MRQWVMVILVVCGMMVGAGPVQGEMVDNGDGTVSDTATGLMWQKTTASTTYTWKEALAYCKGLSLANYTDWRLPNVNELLSLVDYTQANPSIDPVLAPDTESRFYWTSSPFVRSPEFAWCIHFYNGYAHYYIVSYKFRVRAVRVGQ